MGRTAYAFGGGLLLLLACLFSGGCGGIDSSGLDPARSVAGFELGVLPGTLVDGALAGGFDLAVSEVDGGLQVDVIVSDAVGLKALYFTIGYDETSYAPEWVEVSPEFGDEAALLSLDILDQPGEVHCGRVLTHYPDRPGYTGSGTLATVRFNHDALSAWRRVKAIPVTDGSQALLEFDGATGELDWRFYSHGDYNLDKLVAVSDMTAVGFYYDQEVTGAPDSLIAAADGISDGRITVSDITPIGVNYGNMVSGFNIYASASPDDYPADNAGPCGPGATLIGYLAYEDHTPVDAERPAFAFTVDSPKAGDSYWVRPTDGTDEGTPSTIARAGVDVLTLAVSSPPGPGSGVDTDPWILYGDGHVLTFVVTDPDDGVVSTSAETAYQLSDPGAGTFNPGTADLVVDTDFVGTFNLSATYDGNLTTPEAVYFDVREGIPPILTFVNMPEQGFGTAADPFIVNTTTTWVFTLFHMLAGEVAGDALATWTVSEETAGDVSKGSTQATLNIEDGFAGVFSISATYDGEPSMPELIHLRVPEPDATVLTLVNTPAIGDGTAISPYRLSTTPDYQFSLVHASSGEVSGDAGTVFTVSDPTAGAIAGGTNTLNVADTYFGDFTLTATYNGIASIPPLLYFEVMEVIPTDPPVAAITADPQVSDATPVEVTLDASGSTDSDGTVEFYSWDFDGDGVYDIEDNTDPTITRWYAGTGVFNATVLVTDNDHATDTAVVAVTITDEGNYHPTAVLTADSTGGEVPVTVNFDATGSSDPETADLHYWWDLDGDGDFETDGGTTPTISREYPAAGHFWVGVKVYDEQDAWDYDEWELTLTSGGNLPPEAELTADPVYINPPPGTVDFNAGDSLDEDGTIVSYRWDFDGDGSYDEGPAPAATTSHEYTTTGNYVAVVEVTDDDGDTDTATVHITLTDSPAAWHLYEVYTPDGTVVTSAGRFNSLRMVDGLPAVAFQATYAGDAYSKEKAMYVRATEANGSAWGTPVILDDPYFEQESSGIEIDLKVIDGNPAVCFARHEWVSSAWRYGLYFRRAADGPGTDWTPAVADVDSPSDDSRGTHCNLVQAAGHPGICYFDTGDQTLYYISATGADGSAWGTPQLLDDNSEVATAYSSGEYNSLCLVNGNPAIAYLTRVSDISAGYHLRYIRATDTGGTAWGSAQSVDVEQNLAQGISMCILASGNPAIAYSGADDSNNYLYFSGASNDTGSTWNPRVTAAAVSGWDNMVSTPSLAVFAGQPVAAFMRSGFMDGSLKFTRGMDATGSTWQAPENVCDPGDSLDVSCCVVNGMPAVSYQDEGTEALYFAIYY